MVYGFMPVSKAGSKSTILYGINNGRVEVGSYVDSSGKIEPLVDVNGQLMAFDSQQLKGASAIAFGVNDTDVVVGSYQLPGSEHGFVYDNGNIITVDVPKGSFTEVLGVNNSGQIAGSYIDAKGHEDGFIAQIAKSGKAVSGFKTFDVPGSTGTTVNGINDAGDIVGSYFKGNVEHGFIETAAGVFKSITYPKAKSTVVDGINASGEISGTYTDASGTTHGFVMAKNGTFVRLDDPKGSATFARGINNSGQVVGDYDANGKITGFIATPPGATLAHALFDAAFGGAPMAAADHGHFTSSSFAPLLLGEHGQAAHAGKA